MWAITGIVVATLAIFAFEFPYLRKKKLRKELWVFSVLLLCGFGLGVALSLHIRIPSPLDGLIVVYKPLGEVLFGLLK